VSRYQVQVTDASGNARLVGATYATCEEAEYAMITRRAEGEYTDGRDVGGDLYAPCATRIVKVAP
jgi:hypothetical protein